jgi:hypothetical protein
MVARYTVYIQTVLHRTSTYLLNATRTYSVFHNYSSKRGNFFRTNHWRYRLHGSSKFWLVRMAATQTYTWLWQSNRRQSGWCGKLKVTLSHACNATSTSCSAHEGLQHYRKLPLFPPTALCPSHPSLSSSSGLSTIHFHFGVNNFRTFCIINAEMAVSTFILLLSRQIKIY